MSFFPSASPPAVHQLKNSSWPVAAGSALMPSAASASIMFSVVDVLPPAVGDSIAAPAVLVGVAPGVGVGVASAPHADSTGSSTNTPAAIHAHRDLASTIFFSSHGFSLCT